MKFCLIPLILVCFVVCCSDTKYKTTIIKTERFNIESKFVKDSFDIHITFPLGYDTSSRSFPVIYYMDANLKSGNKLREIVDQYAATDSAIPAILVGVGHFSNYRELRRRDLITPFVETEKDSLISDETNFGHSEDFYLFLKNELVPRIESKYKASAKDRTFIGHSLGGLFAFYCLFKKDRLFTTHISLSPALWINYGNIYQFEKKYRKDSLSLHARMYLCVGGRERFNYILSGGRKMNQFLTEQPYTGLDFTYKEFDGETHNSEVPLALKMILPKLYVKSSGD